MRLSHERVLVESTGFPVFSHLGVLVVIMQIITSFSHRTLIFQIKSVRGWFKNVDFLKYRYQDITVIDNN